MLDLILKDIQDPYTRENFFRLRRFLSNQVIFDGDFKLFDVSIPQQDANFKVKHGLTFIPADLIPLAAEGNYNYFFKYQDFDRENIYINAKGPVRLRFLAGKLKDQLGNTAREDSQGFPFVSPGDTSAPGFIYGAVGAKTAGFWLTSEAIPTNVVGIPVLFSDAEIIYAAVGTELEATYTVGIFQHEGAGINLTQIGTISVTSGGDKRFALNIPVVYSSNNVQLACRLLTGNTLNLKVSLVLKGTITL